MGIFHPNITEEVIYLNHIYSIEILPNTLTVCVISALAITGNIIVMYIHWRKLHSMDNFRIFIPFLALSDSIASLVSTSLAVYWNMNWILSVNPIVCKASWFTYALLESHTFVLLFAIAVQRYLVICHPHRKPLSGHTKIILFCAALCFLAVESIPFLFFSDTVEITDAVPNMTIFDCRHLLNHTLVHSVYHIGDDVFICLLIVCVAVLYIRSGTIVSHLSKKMQIEKQNIKRKSRFVIFLQNFNCRKKRQTVSTTKMTNSSMQEENAANSQDSTKVYGTKSQKYRNISLMFITITVTTIVSQVPTFVFNGLQQSDRNFWYKFRNGQLNIMLMLRRLYLVVHFLNPVIYSMMDTEFRQELTKLCRCFFKNSKNKLPISESSSKSVELE